MSLLLLPYKNHCKFESTNIFYQFAHLTTRTPKELKDLKILSKRKLGVSAPLLPLCAENNIINKINQLRDALIPVSGVLIKIFALQEARNYVTDFSASDGWLSNFQHRHNLVLRKGTKRAPKISKELYADLLIMQNVLFTLTTENHYEYLINFDETPICFDLTFDHTYAKEGSTEILISKYDNSKNRITVILGIIMKNPFLPPDPIPITKTIPMVIFKGKTDKCHPVWNENDHSLLIRHQPKAWCDTALYCDCLRNSIPAEIRNKKILIVHDNFEAHITSPVEIQIERLGYSTFCLPPNSTYACQPLDVGINKPFKTFLKEQYISYLVNSVGQNVDTKVNKNKLVQWIKATWERITNQNIASAFRTCGFGIDPGDHSAPIYWKRLSSLQQQLQEQQSLPSINSLIGNVFLSSNPENSHPTVFLYNRELLLDNTTTRILGS